MGILKRKQPVLAKEGIRPALMIPASTPSPRLAALAKDAPQSHANPAVQIREDVSMAVLEVLKPARQCEIDVGDDRLQAVPVVTSESSPGSRP